MKSFFTRNPLMKALSLAVAIGFWWVVHEEKISEANVAVRVETKNIPENLVIASEIEAIIRIQVKGPKSRTKNLDDKNIPPYVLDLSEAKAGVNAYTIYAEDFRVPRGTRVTRIVPQVIRVNLDTAEERLVRVDPKFTGGLEEGFEIEAVEVTPPYLKVRAARSELESMSTLRTEPISLVDRTDTFEGLYRIEGISPHWIVQDKKVSVKVMIREKQVSRIIEDVPITVAGLSRGVKVEPSTVALRVRGLAGKVATVMDEKMGISIDGKALGLEKLGKNSYRIRPVAPKRAGVEITMIPDNVRVTIIKTE
jgi:hypothetical protein